MEVRDSSKHLTKHSTAPEQTLNSPQMSIVPKWKNPSLVDKSHQHTYVIIPQWCIPVCQCSVCVCLWSVCLYIPFSLFLSKWAHYSLQFGVSFPPCPLYFCSLSWTAHLLPLLRLTSCPAPAKNRESQAPRPLALEISRSKRGMAKDI